jgi:hypothetical protein
MQQSERKIYPPPIYNETTMYIYFVFALDSARTNRLFLKCVIQIVMR